jgi:hypothetical protein
MPCRTIMQSRRSNFGEGCCDEITAQTILNQPLWRREGIQSYGHAGTAGATSHDSQRPQALTGRADRKEATRGLCLSSTRTTGSKAAPAGVFSSPRSRGETFSSG